MVLEQFLLKRGSFSLGTYYYKLYIIKVCSVRKKAFQLDICFLELENHILVLTVSQAWCALNCNFVYLAISRQCLVFMRKQNLLVLFICKK